MTNQNNWTENQTTAQLKYLLKENKKTIENLKESNREIREQLKSRR